MGAFQNPLCICHFYLVFEALKAPLIGCHCGSPWVAYEFHLQISTYSIGLWGSWIINWQSLTQHDWRIPKGEVSELQELLAQEEYCGRKII